MRCAVHLAAPLADAGRCVLTAALALMLWSQQRAAADLSAGLVAHYPLDGNGSDASGNGRNGTLMGDVAPAADRFGNATGAMRFDGDGDYIVAAADGLPTGERTTAFWFFANTVADHPFPFGYGGGQCGTSWFVAINAPAVPGQDYPNAMLLSSHCNVNNLLYHYSSPPEGSWYHWAVMTDASGSRMYLNGVLVASNNNFIASTSVNGTHLSLGIIPGGDGVAPFGEGYLDGRLDDVRIYDRALSPTEIRELALYPPSVPGVSDWRLAALVSGLLAVGLLWARRARLRDAA